MGSLTVIVVTTAIKRCPLGCYIFIDYRATLVLWGANGGSSARLAFEPTRTDDAMKPTASAETRIKQLCCLGLGGEAAIPAVLAELHALIPSYANSYP
ncbi:MAG TPA: hypothetical protein VFL97_09125 [Nitrococcus sp.]|nr:hypothetical protein [Nitrococcus sp.]